MVEYRTRNREVAGSTHTWSTAINLEQVANLLYVQLALSLQPSAGREIVASVADWDDGVSGCTVGPIVH